MELTINVEALDKTASAVASAADRTVLTELQLLVAGNVEPITLRFCNDDGATPSWVTDAATAITAGIGYMTPDGLDAYAVADTFTISGSTRLSTINLGSPSLLSALTNALNSSPGLRAPFTWEIRKASADGDVETLALLRVFLAARVLPTGAVSTTGSIVNGAITALTGDVTAVGPGSVPAALAATGVTAGAYTLPTLTIDAKGRVTAASNGATGNLTETSSSVLTIIGGTGAVLGSGVSILVKQASASQGGYLSAADWTTFNAKQPAGNYLTGVTASAPLSGAGTVGSPLVIAQAGAATDGYLSSSDWNTFNNKQAAGTYVTAITVASSNGFAGSSSGGATPQLTLSTTVNGLVKGNGTALSAATAGTDYSAGTSGLGTGILKSTTGTGDLTIAVAGDFPTLNQNTTGSAASLTTARAIYGNNFDGSAALTQIIASTYGGTGNGFTKFTGPTTSEKTFTLPNSSETLLYSGGALGTPSSGTVTNLTGTASININGTVGATTPTTGAFTTVSLSGNQTFSSTAQRVLGDFTNATIANRVLFQTSTVNGVSDLGVIPNGTAAVSRLTLYNSSDPDNAVTANLRATATGTFMNSGHTGTATTQNFGIQLDGVTVATFSGTGVAITGVVSTTDPAGGAGPNWKLGVAASVSPTSPNRTVRIDIGGTSYYLAAKTTND